MATLDIMAVVVVFREYRQSDYFLHPLQQAPNSTITTTASLVVNYISKCFCSLLWGFYTYHCFVSLDTSAPTQLSHCSNMRYYHLLQRTANVCFCSKLVSWKGNTWFRRRGRKLTDSKTARNGRTISNEQEHALRMECLPSSRFLWRILWSHTHSVG
jgi:hypothetical protein